jgi:hypothetical protein
MRTLRLGQGNKLLPTTAAQGLYQTTTAALSLCKTYQGCVSAAEHEVQRGTDRCSLCLRTVALRLNAQAVWLS